MTGDVNGWLREAGIVYLEETWSPVRKSCTHLLPVGVAGEPIFRNRTRVGKKN